MIRPSKYRNVKTTVDNITFASKAEARRWMELNLLQQANLITGLRRQVAYRLTVNDHDICKYVVDFQYFDLERDRALVVEDVKGQETETYKLKRKLMKALWGIEIKEIRYGGRR
jgi:hypothetical protein